MILRIVAVAIPEQRNQAHRHRKRALLRFSCRNKKGIYSHLPSVCLSNTAGAGCRGQENGSAVLDIHPNQRYVVEKAAAR